MVTVWPSWQEGRSSKVTLAAPSFDHQTIELMIPQRTIISQEISHWGREKALASCQLEEELLSQEAIARSSTTC